MDALTLVRRDHRRLEGLLERCQRGDAGAGDRAALDQLRAALRHHVDQEEGILYPIFRERARRAGLDLTSLDQAVQQHRLLDRLAGELPDAGDGGLAAKIAGLTEQVRTHLDEEDSVLLTAIEDLLDDDTLLDLGRRMEQRDRVIQARRELTAMVPGDTRTRRLAAGLGGLAAAGATLLAVLVRRRRPPPRRPTTGSDRPRRR